MPLEKLAVLQQYARELRTRKGRIDPAFAGPIIEALAEQAASYASHRPGDAVAAALALDVAAELGLPPAEREHPSAEAVLAGAARPAEAICQVSDRALWPAAMEALTAREDAHDQLARLLRIAPAERLDEVAARAGSEATAALAAEAVTDPLAHLEACLWLWHGPAERVADAPPKVELFRRLMDALSAIRKDLEMSREAKRDMRQRIRSALTAGDFASYRRMIREVDEAVAATILNLIHRSHGLSAAAAHDMVSILREQHYTLFLTEKTKPWEDENTIWTSEAALHAREDELKRLVEIKMAENAAAIGEVRHRGARPASRPGGEDAG